METKGVMMTESSNVMFSPVFLDKNPPEDTRIDELIQWGKRFHEMGAVKAKEGNLSFRTKLGFIITGTGTVLGELSKELFVEVRGVVFGLNKNSVYIKGQVVPSVETVLHSGIYETLPDVNVIFHSHDGRVLKAADKLGLLSTETEQTPGSPELAEEAIRLVKSSQAIKCFILKNHGVITMGSTVTEAGKLMEELHEKSLSLYGNKVDSKK
jgi:L-fuculose-phosphate aldolase